MLDMNTTKQKKPSKYDKISPVPFIEVAEESPREASKQLRDIYDELGYRVNVGAICCIWDDNNPKGWHMLAELLVETDPVLAKTIYMNLLRLRNFPPYIKLPEKVKADMDIVSQKLYNLERKRAETSEKFQIFCKLVECSSPSQKFWKECLEQIFEFALERVEQDEDKYIDVIAKTAFYAQGMPLLKKKALNEVSKRLRSPCFLEYKNRPDWHKGYFLKNMSDFCVRDNSLYSRRNISFPADKNSDLYKLLNKIFWQWVKERAKERSHNALVLLKHAICSYDEKLSFKASKIYKNIFYKIAVENPEEASKCLKDIASDSCYSFTEGGKKEDRYQNFNLYYVFDKTIYKLMKIDRRLGLRPFTEFVINDYVPYKPVSLRMYNKYRVEINEVRDRIKNGSF